MAMFSEWISLRAKVEENFGVTSVLSSYPPSVGKEVVSAVMRSLLYLPMEKKTPLKEKGELDWTMEVICYGLTLPLSEVGLETIKNCTHLYLDWTTVMSPTPKYNIPFPIIHERNNYFRKMLNHLTNLFLPRDTASTVVLQAKLCSQVLYHVKSIVQAGKLNKELWEEILIFYLGVSGHLLSPPPMPGGLAEHLCEQLINTLFYVWLLACCNQFPSPPLWATLRDYCQSWRHHHTLIVQWNKLMCSLTWKMIQVLYGPDCFPESVIKEEDRFSLPYQLAPDLSVQCWFRFLHIIGSPVILSKPSEITNSQLFIEYALQQGKAPDEHPSLRSLPESFLKAMKGVSNLVNMFLSVSYIKDGGGSSVTTDHGPKSPLGPHPELRRHGSSDMLSTVMTVPGPSSPGPSSPDLVNKEEQYFSEVGGQDSYKDLNGKTTRTDMRIGIGPSVNSILHTFGSWLFDACLSGVEVNKVLQWVSKIRKSFNESYYQKIDR